MVVYVKSPDHEVRRLKVAREIRGRLAMYTLLRQQRQHCGLDVAAAEAKIARAERERSAHEAAPAGTSFVSLTDGSEGTIWIVGPNREEIYLGPSDGFGEGA